MSGATRRTVLAGTMVAAGTLAAPTPALALAKADQDSIAADLARYIELGIKASGGPGDEAVGEWLAGRLARSGFTVERAPFSVPFFEEQKTALSCGVASARVIAQAPVVTTPPGGICAPLVLWHAGDPVPPPLKGKIALIALPHRRWSSILAGEIRKSLAAAEAGGALAVLLVTHGPTGKAIALNAPAHAPPARIPVAILAPDQAAPFITASANEADACLRVEGNSGHRQAWNFIGRLDRGRGQWIIVSTPRSGWFTCAGERGPGVAVWLDLARWMPLAFPDHDLLFVSASGHEYEYLGAERFLAEHAPPPDKTAFWFHLGANVAARDWQEAGPMLLPLPSADTQRFLVMSDAEVPAARRAFAGLPGLEMAYPASKGAAGELAGIAKAGFTHFGGIFGAHRFHHVAEDDERCVHAPLVEAAATASRNFLKSALA